MVRRRGNVTLAILSLFAAACSNFGLVGDNEQLLVSVANLDEGGYLESTEPVLVRITAPPGGAGVLSIAITLLDAAGATVWDSLLDLPPLNEGIEVGPFSSLDLPAGVYSLRFVIATDDGATVTEELTFFHIVGVFSLQSIKSFPPVSDAGSIASLAASLLTPDGGDPYLRWWHGADLIAEGLLSDGLDVASWRTPNEAGIYVVSLELVPIEPPSSAMVVPLPHDSLDVSVYVVEAEATEPSARHTSLLRFDATLGNSGYSLAAAPARVVSGYAPIFTALGSDIGYLIDPDRVLELPHSIIPTDADGPLPFSITLSLLAEAPRGSLLHSSAGDFAISIQLGDGAIPVAAVSLGTRTHELPATRPLGDTPTVITLSATPTAMGISLAWYESGVQTSSMLDAPLNWSSAAVADWVGTTVVGGEEFVGILGELAVYTSDEAGLPSTDPTAAYAIVSAPNEAVWATGFDGSVAHEEFDGVLRHLGGMGLLEPGQSITIAPLDLTAGSLEIGFGPGATLVLAAGPAAIDLAELSRLQLSWQPAVDGIAVDLAYSALTGGEELRSSWQVESSSFVATLTAGDSMQVLLDYLVVRAATAVAAAVPS